MDADKVAAARARRARGESPTAIAKALGVSRASVYRHLEAAEGGDTMPMLNDVVKSLSRTSGIWLRRCVSSRIR
jgi:DNA invertase Pin-like site-specific DNA recombinase